MTNKEKVEQFKEWFYKQHYIGTSGYVHPIISHPPNFGRIIIKEDGMHVLLTKQKICQKLYDEFATMNKWTIGQLINPGSSINFPLMFITGLMLNFPIHWYDSGANIIARKVKINNAYFKSIPKQWDPGK